nr:adenylate/guanylate cyclase domain-containing protein [Burkholderia guangdongensis]
MATRAWHPAPYRWIGYALDDWRQTRMLSAKPETRIAVVDIDERSLDMVGPWPWPRAVIARLAQTLFVQYGAKAVALDVIFPEQGATDGDRALLAVAHRYPLVFAQAFSFTSAKDAPHVGHLDGALPGTDGDAPVGDAPVQHASMPAASMPAATGFIGNFFNDPSVCAGHVTPQTSLDGVVRSIAPMIRYAGVAYPMLTWQLLHCAQRRAPASPASALPIDTNGLMHIPFDRALSAFDVIPALDVLTGRASADLLAHRYVLIGSSALGLTDHVASPIDPWLPAVIVHAELLSNLLDLEAGHARAPDARWLPLVWAVGSIVGFAWLFMVRRAAAALLIVIAATAVWLALVATMRAIPADLAALPLVPSVIFLLAQAPIEWISSQAAIRSFELRFSRYLPPVVLKEIARSRRFTLLAPERRQISVLFVDIEGYTRLAEQMPPEALVTMTEIVLTRLTGCVHDTEGTLDKYMGDALMAFWGAPLAQPDHADRALDCARVMLRELDALNRSHVLTPGGEPVRVRIGVNSGMALVGEIGSTMRKSYTAIGDVVNVAARLQEYAKVVQTDLLIGEETARSAMRHRLRECAHAAMRGRDAAEFLYVLDEGGSGALA